MMVGVDPKKVKTGRIKANPSTANKHPVNTEDTSPTDAIVPA